MWFSILIITAILYVFHLYYDSIRALYISRKTLGPPAYPIIGSALYFLNKTSAEIFQIGVGLTKEYGFFFKFWLGPELKFTIQDPKDIEIILSSMRYIDKAYEYNFLKPWLNDGLLVSTGKKWHDRRKIITPAFHFKMLEKFTETFDRISNTFIEKIQELDSDKAIELFHMVELFALDVICETAMGVEINALSRPDLDYVKAVKEISDVVFIRSFNFAYRQSFLYKFTKLHKIEANALRVLHDFADGVIRKRRKELIENNDENDNSLDEIGIRKKRAFLDILLHSTINGKPLTDLEIREEVDTFIFGGQDTTTSAITFILYNIAKHPEIQQKCFNEIVEVFEADTQQPATISLLNQLPYLELAIKESLRLFSTVPVVARTAMEDIELTNNRIIPRGSTIIIPFFTICRNPEYFEEPECFRPERFLDQQIMEKKNPYAYIPFSAGPRMCIGQKFAMYEMKCVISKVLHNFEVSLTEESIADPVLSAALVLRPESAIKFYFKRRTLR